MIQSSEHGFVLEAGGYGGTRRGDRGRADGQQGGDEQERTRQAERAAGSGS